MISCTFESGGKARLRHVVTHAIVEKDGAILLVKRAPPLLESGKWGLPGGFLDMNETGEEGALRELLEETGWNGKIRSCMRVNTTPRTLGCDRQNVVVEFIVTPGKQVQKPDHESTDVAFFSFEEIAVLAKQGLIAFDHADSIALYQKTKRESISLPVVV